MAPFNASLPQTVAMGSFKYYVFEFKTKKYFLMLKVEGILMITECNLL